MKSRIPKYTKRSTVLYNSSIHIAPLWKPHNLRALRIMSAVFTAAQVAKHNTESDCWVIIDGVVYDSTEWLMDHPGGKKIIMGLAGKDCTKHFNTLHSRGTKKKLLKGKFVKKMGTLASSARL